MAMPDNTTGYPLTEHANMWYQGPRLLTPRSSDVKYSNLTVLLALVEALPNP